MSVRLVLLNDVLARRDFNALVRNGLNDPSAWHEQADAFRFIASHVVQYGEMPSLESVIRACPTFERADVMESTETLIAKVHENNVKIAERRILEEAAKMYAKSDGYALMRFLETELDKIRQDVNALTGVGAANWTRNVDQRLIEYDKRASGEYGTSIPMFWPAIDDAVGGFHRGDYVNILAWTKKGKSWLGLIAGLHANRAGYKVLAELAESTKPEATYRLDTLEFGISNRALFTGTLDEHARATYARKLEELRGSGRPDFVIKTPEDWHTGLTPQQLEADIDQYSPDVVIIDQFSLMRYGNNDRQAKEDLSKALKLMFTRKGVLGIVITQANGSYGKREQLRDDDEGDVCELNPPSEADYSQTIATIQDATHVLGFDSSLRFHKAKMIVQISRTGGASTEVDLSFFPDAGVIRPREPQEDF